MRVRVADKLIRNNIQLFLELVKKVELKRQHSGAPVTEHSFPVYVNVASGKLFAPDLVKEHYDLSAKEWKQLQIQNRFDPMKQELYFEVTSDGQTETFSYSELTEVAFRALDETMKVLNHLAHQLQGPSDFATKIQVICKAEVIPTPEKEQNLVYALWHHADRQEAEVLLKGKPVGTYFFRKDPYAALLETELSAQHQKSIQCITLTFLEQDGKITDMTLVHVDHAWKFYNDDVTLSMPGSEEVQQLLQPLNDRLRYPLYHSKL